MIKKSTVIKLAIAAGLMTGLATGIQYANSNVFTPQTVEASSKFKVKLAHNAYVYNYRGKRRGKRVLKKGKVYTAYRTKRINHKKYYYLGHHNYIKAANAKTYKKAASKYLFTVKVTLGSEIDLKPEGQISPWDMTGTVKVYEVKKLNGHTWYKLGKNRWVKASETNRNPDSKTRNNSNTPNSTNSEATNSSKNESQSESQYKYTDRGVQKLTAKEIQQIKVRFLKDVNNWRKQQSLKPFNNPDWINEGSQLRANESIPHFLKTMQTNHERPNGQGITTAFSYPSQVSGEVTAWFEYGDEPADELADEAFESFVYNDADSNWGHRRVLGWNYANPIMGIGVTSVIKNGSPFMIIYADTGNGTN